MKISVALCTYNGSKYLKYQLESILSQTLKVDEIVVCDDGSTDTTVACLEEYSKHYPNLFKIYKNDYSLRTVKNFEKAISLTTGDLVFLADQDDFWMPSKVAEIVHFFEKNTDCTMVFTDGELINEYGMLVGGTLFTKWNFNKDIQDIWEENSRAIVALINFDNKITGATACFKRSLISSFMPMNLPCGMWHDAWIGLHAARNDGLRFINKCLIQYRVHSNQQVGVQQGWNLGDEANDCSERGESYENYLKANFTNWYLYYNNRKRSFFERVKSKLKRKR
ncbi:glycosyltransferase [Elizabethkingia anophelis]|uniref:Chondroitin polymerase n=1 Tax=Elizabethkingia anophelis TaxID=1117645 RepID=A0A1T3D8Q5_9FLAO|nr:glycosyltransferase [Elizabethkingia anophelis]AQW97093.1 hypothetical protein BBD31_03915 [Elizabethkingia anophelis]AQX49342.1 hypothetical protein AYC66_00985 [Elizabethkingia anophelis]AQX87687.1 hypothetical protein AYC67_00985 [Elizabethkingia anophelis]AVF48027.1 hypothetical protein AL491_08045 [Elizabethkingia anophelis]AVF52021.1 hypothetical protein AL492_10455 [Elizabethkingia anophelis]